MDSALQYKIQKIQNACLRFSFCLKKRDHITPSLSLSKWLNMSNRRNSHNFCFVYKVLHQLLPSYLSLRITDSLVDHEHNTRQYLYHIPVASAKTHIKYNSFYVKIIKEYNRLPSNIKTSTSISSFKHKVIDWLLSNQTS